MKLEGADAQLVNIMVRVGRARSNWDHLITEALKLLAFERRVAGLSALLDIEELGTFDGKWHTFSREELEALRNRIGG
jgi:hypothetical protein